MVAGADIVNSVDAQLSNTVSQRQIIELPLNGRNPLTLVQLQAGTSSNSAQTTTINGQRSPLHQYHSRRNQCCRTIGFAPMPSTFLPDRPNVDDTGEFTIVTQNAGARSRLWLVTQVQLVTPRAGQTISRHAGFSLQPVVALCGQHFLQQFLGACPGRS